MTLKVPDQLRADVQALERDADAAGTAAYKASQSREQAEEAIKTHRKTMGFWDRNFWGVFGNKEKVREHKKLKSLSAEFNKRAAIATTKKNEIETSIDRTIETFLQKGDTTYQNLQVPRNAATSFRNSARDFLYVIDSALDAVRKAQSMETNDMLSDSSYFSTASHFDNLRAKDMIQRVRAAAPGFQRAAAAYNNDMASFKANGVDLNIADDTIDFVLDMSGINVNFDMSSMLMLNALGRAKTDLESLRRTVVRADSDAERCLSTMKKATDSYKKKVRNACKLTP